MFTGIIEAIGSIKSISINHQGARLTVHCPSLDMSDVKLGDSIATNGICLTVVAFDSTSYSADISNETLERTAFGGYQQNQQVNLEKAMLPTTRFGGHMVSGHVDAVAEIKAITKNGNSVEYWLSMDASIAPYIAEKGSITVDGVSLTVNSLAQDQFRLTIVPHTTGQTIIPSYQLGTKVNIEVDVMARYIERLLQSKQAANTSFGVTEALLAQSGFIKN
ncbi:riboflavin synthase subunit alpha [Thalassotalea insulae]|uniref:Riboflavin synthase n=1 Tax=Thalassotalea insulae TaxID=2056778 RepID=A0ABQ6GTJ8_9GAMM|nr:riboflavin synthase [Thalassotalea insulae]GLX79263.1 riboflavin synthase subunit alpha [Thalassotalea insulae]